MDFLHEKLLSAAKKAVKPKIIPHEQAVPGLKVLYYVNPSYWLSICPLSESV